MPSELPATARITQKRYLFSSVREKSTDINVSNCKYLQYELLYGRFRQLDCSNDTGKSFPMLQKFLPLGQMRDLPEAGSVKARASVIGELVLTL